MLRPGRLDAVIAFVPPDAEAAERLIRAYAGKLLAPGTDLKHAGAALAGRIPAVVREAIERAKLVAIATTKGEEFMLTGPMLVAAARSMDFQLALLDRTEPESVHVGQAFAEFALRGANARVVPAEAN
jgi:transitional endoplasmic reticulum ATPase